MIAQMIESDEDEDSDSEGDDDDSDSVESGDEPPKKGKKSAMFGAAAAGGFNV